MGVGGKVIALGSCSLWLSRAVAVGVHLISFFFFFQEFVAVHCFWFVCFFLLSMLILRCTAHLRKYFMFCRSKEG